MLKFIGRLYLMSSIYAACSSRQSAGRQSISKLHPEKHQHRRNSKTNSTASPFSKVKVIRIIRRRIFVFLHRCSQPQRSLVIPKNRLFAWQCPVTGGQQTVQASYSRTPIKAVSTPHASRNVLSIPSKLVQYCNAPFRELADLFPVGLLQQKSLQQDECS